MFHRASFRLLQSSPQQMCKEARGGGHILGLSISGSIFTIKPTYVCSEGFILFLLSAKKYRNKLKCCVQTLLSFIYNYYLLTFIIPALFYGFPPFGNKGLCYLPIEVLRDLSKSRSHFRNNLVNTKLSSAYSTLRWIKKMVVRWGQTCVVW
jgi:hypothetical protein